LHASIRLCCIPIILLSTEGYIGSKVSSVYCEVLVDVDGVLFMEEYILLRGTSSSSDDEIDDEEEEEGELVLVS